MGEADEGSFSSSLGSHLTCLSLFPVPLVLGGLTRLREASQDAARYRSPLGRRSRLEALGDMIKHLKGVYPNVAVRDARLSSRLGKVVDAWLTLAQQEQKKLQQMPDYIGRIDNPYNPGGALKADDPRFTGRLDLVRKLEKECRVPPGAGRSYTPAPAR